MGRPAKYTCEEEKREANCAKSARHFEKNRDLINCKRLIKYHNKCLTKPNLTEKQRKKHELKLFELNQQLEAYSK